ncbi:MAG: 1-(5-phosphoribosyl)-5-[(5-phosphoribosylamino)methylideneamino]imidazole-4-carboxamide isomerase [Candidatus Schekmanbacteria bacterium]|nr:1-(5-phosphoribosyl)-5-[(5-phosphoribosylamino)methylideneamino]imidazole-4-carboxamide isomerase [Candidatus Schekmanbacteria bacterium]
MLIIPAIDLRGEKCVRLIQGDFSREKVYSSDPVDIAMKFKECGAKLIHVVDLDGARTGAPGNLKSIERLLHEITVPIEVGGGIRTYEVAKGYVEMGVKRIILGTAAIKNRALLEKLCTDFPGKIVVGIDTMKGKIAIEGWEKDTGVDLEKFIKEINALKPSAIICTDISRDGMLTGPNISFMENILGISEIPVVASGGVSRLEDLVKLVAVRNGAIEGVIVGKAIYEGQIDLKEAIKVIEGK